jgi:hypothetical protein
LEFREETKGSIPQIAHTIDQFEALVSKVDSIEIVVTGAGKKTKDLEILANYRVNKLRLLDEDLFLETFHHMKNNFNYLTELSIKYCQFDELDHTALNFVRQLSSN